MMTKIGEWVYEGGGGDIFQDETEIFGLGRSSMDELEDEYLPASSFEEEAEPARYATIEDFLSDMPKVGVHYILYSGRDPETAREEYWRIKGYRLTAEWMKMGQGLNASPDEKMDMEVRPREISHDE